jgi:hypothetical protein
MANGGARKVIKPVAAAAVTLGTIASIWWFALKPRRKSKDVSTTVSSAPENDGRGQNGRSHE